jgi:ribosomal protein S18 acetylase RimI-like enzyme
MVGPTFAPLIVRQAVQADMAVCRTLDHSYSTDYVWQMDLDEMDGTLNVSFRAVRLPRSMKVLYPRGGEALEQSWDQQAYFAVAEREHQVLGYVNVREEPAQETAWVADLAVDRPHRLSGVGSRLLGAARKWAYERKLRRLVVETQTKNYPAICFLRKHGFTFCGYNDQYYPNQDIAVFFGLLLR